MVAAESAEPGDRGLEMRRELGDWMFSRLVRGGCVCSYSHGEDRGEQGDVCAVEIAVFHWGEVLPVRGIRGRIQCLECS